MTFDSAPEHGNKPTPNIALHRAYIHHLFTLPSTSPTSRSSPSRALVFIFIHLPCHRQHSSRASPWARRPSSQQASRSLAAPRQSSKHSYTRTASPAVGPACRLPRCPPPRPAPTTRAPARGQACPATSRATSGARRGRALTRGSRPRSRRALGQAMSAPATSMLGSRTSL